MQNLHYGILIIRIGIGFMFILHGWPKLAGGPEKWEAVGNAMTHFGINLLPVVFGFLAAVAETVGGLLLILGILFKPAAVTLLLTMIVAAVYHLGKGDGLMGASHAIESAVIFFGLLVSGPGRYRIKF